MVLWSIASTLVLRFLRLAIPAHFVDSFSSLWASKMRPWRSRFRALSAWTLDLLDAVVIAQSVYGMRGGVVNVSGSRQSSTTGG